MQSWGEQYKDIILRSNFRLKVFGGYVDDIRQGTNKIPMGFRFCKEENKIIHRLEWETVDRELGETDLKRMTRVCQAAMNSPNPDLQFTLETTEDFENKRLQTLDFEIWVEDGLIKHSFFEKPMQTTLVTMERSAMGTKQKHSILENDLVRRLSNVSETVTQDERIKIVDLWLVELRGI